VTPVMKATLDMMRNQDLGFRLKEKGEKNLRGQKRS
jgi:hypothetical protein